jgi:hypothetical protein
MIEEASKQEQEDRLREELWKWKVEEGQDGNIIMFYVTSTGVAWPNTICFLYWI